MDMTKTEDQSHVTDCSDAMTTFISKEGANSYPTSVVLMNRFFCSPDEYDWQKNSSITLQWPQFKVGDDLHWYKLKDLYTNLKNAVISGSIFKDINIFKDETFTTPSNVSLAFQTKNKFYLYNNKTKQIYWSPTFDKNSFTHYTSIDDQIVNPIDFLSIGTTDYLLCKNAIYRFKSDDTYSKVYDELGTSYNAFETGLNKIIVASDNGAKIFSDNGDVLSLEQTVVYKFTIESIPNPNASSDSSGGSSGSSDEPSTISVTIPNGIPSSNRCTFVWVEDSYFYCGDTTISCKLPILGPYEHTPTPEQLEDATINPGKKVSSTNRHYMGVNGIETSSIILDEDSTSPISTVSGYEYDGKVYSNISGVTGVFKEQDITYIFTFSGIKIFLNDDVSQKLTEFNSSNGLSGTSNFVYVKDGDIWVLLDGKWRRTLNPKDEEIPFGFIVFAFNFESDGDKDTVDCRLAYTTVGEVLSLAYSKAAYDKYFATAMNGSTTFMVSFSKGSKTVFNLFGNDERRAKAEEMKDCCSAFDIGED